MADAPESPDAVDAADASPKKKGKLLLLLLPVLALALGGGGGYVYYAQAAPADADAEVVEEEPVREFGEFANLPGIIVNPAGTGGRRYLLVDLSLEVDDAKAVEEISRREIVIRDAIVRTLGEHSVEQLASLPGREALKDTILVHVNDLLEQDVRRLYFTQYVLQ